MTRHYFGFSILILFLALVQIPAMEPSRQQAETGPVQKVVPSIISDGYTINLSSIPSNIVFDSYDPAPVVGSNTEFNSHVTLPVPSFPNKSQAALTKSSILENDVAYLRVGEIQNNLAGEIQSTQSSLAATNTIAGTILDLRFTGGDDLAAAKATADLFAAKKLPLAILVGSGTRGAALTLATSLRKARDGLVFGSAVAELKPDIAVTLNIADEKFYFDNPYASLAQTETNSIPATNSFSPFIDHTSEADLVRAKIKDGDQDTNTPARPAEPPKPFIHDPVLARAVDLIKALAVVHRPHA